MTPSSIVEAYFKELKSKFGTDRAREHTYRPALESLIKAIDPTINPLNDSARTEHGAPDFVFMRKEITAG